MEAILDSIHYETVKTPQDADLVLVNTCSIREKAENKMSSFAHELKSLKSQKPGMLLGVTGCVAQQEKEQILKELPFVDLVLGPDNIDELPWALEKLNEDKSTPILRTEFDQESRVWESKTLIKNPGPSEFISVMKGCDHYCSYCIVPWTRGRERSRTIDSIIEDTRRLVNKGVREITFLGQNINTFGKRNNESLHELFYRAHEIDELRRIRFTTSHPGDLQDELIQCYVDLPKLCSYFHLPVQSGSDKILRAMRRFYTVEQYMEKVEKLKKARPDIALSSDIIVGFPGETDEDFRKTLEVVKASRYDNLYSFAYSPRPGTSASTRNNQISELEKKSRLMELQNLARQISKESHQQWEGQKIEIMLEGPSKKNPQFWTGRSSQNIPVHLAAKAGMKPGDFVLVNVVEGTLTHLMATLTNAASHKQPDLSN